MPEIELYTPEKASQDLKEMAGIVKEKSRSKNLFDISAAVLDTIHRDEARFYQLRAFYGGAVVQIAKDVALIINDENI